MRLFLLVLLLAIGNCQAFAYTRVNVQQLKATLAAGENAKDADLAKKIGGLQLTERLSAGDLAAMTLKLPGALSREALLALADESGFLAPPRAEIPSLPAPDANEQSRIVGLATDYVKDTLPPRPNFMATRTSVSFQDRLMTGTFLAMALQPDPPWQAVGKTTATVLYRNGREIATHVESTSGSLEGGPGALSTSAAFGPILGTIVNDTAEARMVWSRWEQSPKGPLAVFHFAVPKRKSHYLVSFCCVPKNSHKTYPNGVFEQLAGYKGEMTIDPGSGTILRLVFKAELASDLPIVRADILVEYGPVEIGGKIYVCPLKSVSISRARQPVELRGLNGMQVMPAVLVTMLNDEVFEKYQRFRGDVQILSNGDSNPQE
jgi:hypothetical protein